MTAGKRKLGFKFFFRLFVMTIALAGVVLGVYFSLDKLVVPKYFNTYGINNMHDLVAMVKTLYNSPDEEDIITNAYLTTDLKSATKKLKEANFPVTESGDIDYILLSDGIDRDSLMPGEYSFSDREIAAILDQMLDSKSGVLESKLPNMKYIDIINIDLLEVIIEPLIVGKDDDLNEIYDEDSAKVTFTSKVDTSAVRNQMAKAMDTPLFLLNMIVPETLYITVDYNMQKNNEGEWSGDNGHISINGRTAKDSKILLDLLIDFIFTEEDEMTADKLCEEFGNIIIVGLDVFGDVSIQTNVDESDLNGVIITI